MTWLRTRWLPLTVLVVAVVALVLSIIWVGWIDRDRDRGPGLMGPVVTDVGPVSDIDGARDAAQQFGDRWNLDVGEVMQFENNYYAVLLDDDGTAVTEVLIDPSTGKTHLEWGPAMMWNVAWGMHRNGFGMHRYGASDRNCEMTADEAVGRADEWLRENRSSETASDPVQFPGYYTLHTVDNDGIVGMVSVNCRTDAVWYHTWHGDFVAMSE